MILSTFMTRGQRHKILLFLYIWSNVIQVLLVKFAFLLIAPGGKLELKTISKLLLANHSNCLSITWTLSPFKFSWFDMNIAEELEMSHFCGIKIRTKTRCTTPTQLVWQQMVQMRFCILQSIIEVTAHWGLGVHCVALPVFCTQRLESQHF